MHRFDEGWVGLEGSCSRVEVEKGPEGAEGSIGVGIGAAVLLVVAVEGFSVLGEGICLLFRLGVVIKKEVHIDDIVVGFNFVRCLIWHGCIKFFLTSKTLKFCCPWSIYFICSHTKIV